MEVYRRNHETSGSMLRRFSRKVQQSGLVQRARRLRYYAKPPTPRTDKERAIRRIRLQKEAVRMDKLGRKSDE